MTIHRNGKEVGRAWHIRTKKGWKTRSRNTWKRWFKVRFYAITLGVLATVSYVSITTIQNEVKSPLEYVAEVRADEEEMPAVLARIAKCESGDRHYKENGDVVLSKDKADIGRYQIRVTVWGQDAHRLGYNLFDEKDNQKMAEWIFENHGTEPWYSSKACWK